MIDPIVVHELLRLEAECPTGQQGEGQEKPEGHPISSGQQTNLEKPSEVNRHTYHGSSLHTSLHRSADRHRCQRGRLQICPVSSRVRFSAFRSRHLDAEKNDWSTNPRDKLVTWKRSCNVVGITVVARSVASLRAWMHACACAWTFSLYRLCGGPEKQAAHLAYEARLNLFPAHSVSFLARFTYHHKVWAAWAR